MNIPFSLTQAKPKPQLGYYSFSEWMYPTTYRARYTHTKRARPACFSHTDPHPKRARVISPTEFTHPFREAMSSQDGSAMWDAIWGPRYRPDTTIETTVETSTGIPTQGGGLDKGKGRATDGVDTASMMNSGTAISRPNRLMRSRSDAVSGRAATEAGSDASSETTVARPTIARPDSLSTMVNAGRQQTYRVVSEFTIYAESSDEDDDEEDDGDTWSVEAYDGDISGTDTEDTDDCLMT